MNKTTNEQVVSLARNIATQCARERVSTWTFDYAMTRIMELSTIAYEAGRRDEKAVAEKLRTRAPTAK